MSAPGSGPATGLAADAEREEWFRAAVEGNLNGLYILQAVRDDTGAVADFRYAHVNAQGGRLVGLAAEDMLGRRLCGLFPDLRAHGHFDRYRAVFEEQRVAVDEFAQPLAGGRVRWLREQVVPWSGGVAISAEDISEEVRRKRELEQRHQVLLAFLEQIPGPAWIVDLHGSTRICNARYAALAPPGRLGGTAAPTLEDIFGPALAAVYRANNALVVAEGRVLHTVEQGPRPDGTLGTYEVIKFPLGDPGDPLVGGFALDVTEREQMQRQARLLAAIARESHDAIFAKSVAGLVVEWSGSAERLYGYRADEVLGQPVSMLAPPELAHEPAALLARVARGERVLRHQTRRRAKDGRELVVELSLAPYEPIEGGEPCVAVLATDVGARARAEQRAEYLASHDDATGHFNREGFQSHLVRRLAAGTGPWLVARISLREAETLRELLGTQVVDALVKAYADRMGTALAGWQPLVGRDGPDQLLLALGDGAAGEAALLAAWPALVEPIDHEGQLYSLNPRIGYALGGGGVEDSPDALLRASDVAHGQALARQTSAPIAFEPAMAARLARRIEIQRELVAAVAQDELSLVLQPVFDAAERPVGLEALVRWHSPRLGQVSPAEFIPVAEESSAIIAVGDWVLAEACRCLRALREAGHAGLYIAVNVAEAQLARADFARRVADLLARHGLPADRLELEITERTLMVDTRVHQQNLLALRELGVRLSVDDFGTGYSSLAYLMRFAVDKIKIDRSFVSGLGEHATHEAVVKAMVTLADAVGLACVSEGVETRAQLERLRMLGCGQFQGYLLARPMSPAALRDFLSGPAAGPR